MENLSKKEVKNYELNEWFLNKINSEMGKTEQNRSEAFLNGYDLRGKILDMELTIIKENKLLSILKNKIIADLKAEKLNTDFTLLINN